MYILWSKEEYNDKYILFAKNTIEELKIEYLKFCKENEDDYNFDKELKEQELESFSTYSQDCDFYVSHIENEDANEKIYIFKFHEDGEGGSYHDEIYLHISNNKDKLLKIAIDYFTTESKKTKDKHIQIMLNKLNKKGYYDIPHGITYCCDMYLFEFKTA